METLKDVGGVVGEYVGDGKGEANSSEYLEEIDDHFEVDTPECRLDPIEEQESSPDSGNGHLPLLVLYDCEATGLRIYKEHLTDIAAIKVFNPPVPLPAPAFSSLVRTSRTISAPGNKIQYHNINNVISNLCIVSRITGITSNLLRGEKPLSIVLPKFLEWLTYAVEYISKETGDSYYPGMIKNSSNALYSMRLTNVSFGSTQWISLRFPNSSSRNRKAYRVGIFTLHRRKCALQ